VTREAWLILGGLAGLAWVAELHGARALGDPSPHTLKARARDWLESGLCGPHGEVYHLTALESVPSIQAQGLTPNAREPGFQGFESWSKGKVFFTAGCDLGVWLYTLKNARGRWWTTKAWVVLRVKPGAPVYRQLQHDWESENECSFFTTRRVPASDLELCLPNKAGYAWIEMSQVDLGSLSKALKAKEPYAKLLQELENA